VRRIELNQKPTAAQIAAHSMPFMATRGDIAPTFSAEAYVNNQIKTLKLEDFLGKWTVLFFYSSDFTFV